MKSSDAFYITTAIAYPNGRPHMGHAYEVVATDAIARFHRLDGRTVTFLTGTDEHGLKIAQAARAAGVDPKTYVDKMVMAFQEMTATFQISHDRFIRTTDVDHYAASQALWRAMVAAGDIYLDRYTGWYSVRDEAYYDESELVDAVDAAGVTVRLSPQGTAVEWTVEESWFFRLSTYADRLLAWYDSMPTPVVPSSRHNEMRAFVQRGLRDLSVSRTSFAWGVPVPDAAIDGPAHVMYVWVDALTNYLTGAGYPSASLDTVWPPDLQVVGKDVVRFHAVYWPAILMSAGLALPKAVFGHGFILDRGEKMSKSLGNVVDPLALAATLGVDRLRWFMLRDVVFGEDGNYSHAAIVERTNADLANGIGNLAQRSLAMIAKNCDGRLPSESLAHQPADLMLQSILSSLTERYMDDMRGLRLSRALEALMEMVAIANGYFADNAPWNLKNSDPARMAKILYETADAVRQIAILLQPIVPSAAVRLLGQLGLSVDKTGHRPFTELALALPLGALLPAPNGVFPRWVETT